MIELNEQQRQELSAPEPVAIDPQTRATYVLVRREVYERLKTLLALDDYDPDERLPHHGLLEVEDQGIGFRCRGKELGGMAVPIISPMQEKTCE